MVGTAGTPSRYAEADDRALDREVDLIDRALADEPQLSIDELFFVVGAHDWGPGRFRAALRLAVREGRVAPTRRHAVGPHP
jgi:hypothetical protein